jgi:hypothetical protein
VGGALGRATPGTLRSWGLDQGVDAPDGVGAQHDQGGAALAGPARVWCGERPSRLEPFKDEIHRLLKDEPKLTGVRVRELIEPLGFDGGKTIVDDYVREVRPLFLKLGTHQRTVYRPGEICQGAARRAARVGHALGLRSGHGRVKQRSYLH